MKLLIKRGKVNKPYLFFKLNIMWESIIKIAFEPKFTFSFKEFIKNNVSPEFTRDDEKKHQYSVSRIEEIMEESGESFMENDKNILEELNNQKIEYVEF